ncbi:MAG TPA: DNA mismatch repair endonuclease MutL [Candidatus Acidoferrales bacterium]|nr:DNA mismatch repair endonuclease MutL [Candidatus Acidoferrales bacterium]
MTKIRILPETVANKIAAGEVVERPASVVKEIVENALDAGARTIQVEVVGGGKRLVAVADDGCGMTRDDALLAFERHATSKLRTAEDLLSIATLGFRGEALPSIAAVSRLALETRVAEEEQGTRVEWAAGKMISVQPAGAPVGTKVTISDLFYSLPARRKFLKSDTVELGHIASLVTHYALAFPEKRLLLKTPTQEIINVAPVERLADRIYQLFGRQSLEELIEIPEHSAPMRTSMSEPEPDPGEPAEMLTVRGFASRPQVERTNRNNIYIFVNRRLIRDRLILHAIGEAYRNLMPPNLFPVVLLFLEMPYTAVDVNAHPSKIEVRFRHSSFVHDFVRDSIRLALSRARAVATFPSRPAPVAPGAPAWPSASGPISAAAGPSATVPSAGAAAPLGGPFELTEAPVAPQMERLGFDPGQVIEIPVAPQEFAAQFRQVAETQPAKEVSPESIATLKPLGQVNNSFIIAVNGEGLWVVDQHVAHERVLFEQHLAARRAGQLAGQRLLMPIVVELGPRQFAIFDQIAEELRANGFEVESMGPRSVAIESAPAGVAGSDAEKLLEEILEGIQRENQAVSLETVQAKIAASTACHAAIKAYMPLDQRKMEWLLAELARTEYPMSCPHGRPVLLRYSVRDLEKAFHRI